MMGFVNLLGNDVWSEQDIVRRTEAMVRSEFSLEAEIILNRKVQGVTLGVPISPEDEAELERFRDVVTAAQRAGDEARADMTMLGAVMQYEAVLMRLALPLVADSPQDADERSAAQAVVNEAGADVLELYAQRNQRADVST
ncbi:MAG: hypothetical protein HGA47_06275 [Zoogloea sp.]|nr:hypothetical protein [Zoogloea sp.]